MVTGQVLAFDLLGLLIIWGFTQWKVKFGGSVLTTLPAKLAWCLPQLRLPH